MATRVVPKRVCDVRLFLASSVALSIFSDIRLNLVSGTGTLKEISSRSSLL